MKRLSRTVFAMMLFTVSHMASSQYGDIHVVSEMWPNFTHENGTGLYWDIVNSAYNDENILLEATTYARAFNQFEDDYADIMLGIYSSDIEDNKYLIRSENYIDVDYVAVCIRNGHKFPSVEELKAGVSAWVVDYGYNEIFDIRMFYEVEDRTKGLKMLAKGRVDFFIDALSEITSELDKDLELNAKISCQVIHEESIYLAFHNNARGVSLKQKWDLRFSQLIANGELEKLFAKYNVAYPFLHTADAIK
ncbi:substrate-binding periplasmic protein [Pseudoalteromonas pernae]|uniref:substrate-binding periplasmic protein n=1 Tax=Pseudoalteromonas pernae TaxID=3118054 RepID=UPI0032427486